MPVWSSLTFKLQPNACLDTPQTYNMFITTLYTVLYTVFYSVLYTVLYIEVWQDFNVACWLDLFSKEHPPSFPSVNDTLHITIHHTTL